MRITISIDDDLLPLVRTYAKSRSISAAKAVSELVRRGLHSPWRTRVINGFHVVDLPTGSPAITRDHVRKLALGEFRGKTRYRYRVGGPYPVTHGL